MVKTLFPNPKSKPAFSRQDSFFGRVMNRIFKKKVLPPGSIEIGPIALQNHEQSCGISVIGGPGSGLISMGLLPIVEQVLKSGGAAEERVGGFIDDPTGAMLPHLIQILEAMGRNAAEEIVLVTPIASFDVIEFADTTTGDRFFVTGDDVQCCCRGGLQRLLKSTLPDGAIGDLRLKHGFLRASPRIWAEETLPKIRGMKFAVDHSVEFIGWKRDEKNNTLVRERAGVRQSPFPVSVPVPMELVFVERHQVKNPTHINFYQKDLSAGENAHDLCYLGQGGADGAKDRYWVSSFRKLIAATISLLRETRADDPLSLADIYQVIHNKVLLEKELEFLRHKLQSCEPHLRDRLADLLLYYTSEWADIDPKTGCTIKSIVSNTCVEFALDPELKEIFCSDTTFSFDECINAGKIVYFCAPSQYESVGRQTSEYFFNLYAKSVYGRMTRTELDKNRKQILVINQAYVPWWDFSKFVSLSRQLKTVAIFADHNLPTEKVWDPIKKDLVVKVINEFGCFGTNIFMQNIREVDQAYVNLLLGDELTRVVNLAGLDVGKALIVPFTQMDEARVKWVVTPLKPSPFTSSEKASESAGAIERFTRGIIERSLEASGNGEGFLDHVRRA